MKTLFGVPMDSIMVVLLGVVLLVTAAALLAGKDDIRKFRQMRSM